MMNVSGLSDGRIMVTYRLSGPVTSGVIDLLSQGKPVLTGYQYLSPTYTVYKADGTVITGILKSPIIQITCPSGCQVYTMEYLDALLSTIKDTISPVLLFNGLKVRICSLFSKRIAEKDQEDMDNVLGELIVD
jgi:hypothetical protein